MSYNLYTDKPTQFKCRIQLDGASLKEARARLVVNGPSTSILYEGKIERDGICAINIKNIKEIFEVDDTGEMQLEVIADGNYFQPWSSDFTVTASKKLRVEVITNEIERKPSMKVQIESPDKRLTESIVSELKSAGINRHNLQSKMKLVRGIIKDQTNEFGISYPNRVLTDVIHRVTNA